jgi:hypothetical protein
VSRSHRGGCEPDTWSGWRCSCVSSAGLGPQTEACCSHLLSCGGARGSHSRSRGPSCAALQGIVDSQHTLRPSVRMELPGGEGPIRPDGVVGLATRRRSAGSLAGLLSWMIQRLPLRRQLLRASTPSAPSSPTERGPCRSRQTLVPCSAPEGVLSVARVTTSSSTFGPGLPSPSPVPSLPFLTTSTACSACAVQVCCTLQPTMGFAWFPATPRYPPVFTRLSASNPVPKERNLCGPHGAFQRVSPLDFRPLQAASVVASRSREASVAGRRRRTTGGGRDRSGTASEDGHHRGSHHDRKHTVSLDPRSEDLNVTSPKAQNPGKSNAPDRQGCPCCTWFTDLRCRDASAASRSRLELPAHRSSSRHSHRRVALRSIPLS